MRSRAFYLCHALHSDQLAAAAPSFKELLGNYRGLTILGQATSPRRLFTLLRQAR